MDAIAASGDALCGVVQSQQAEPLWLVNASADQRLSVKAMPPVQPADGGRDYQLWLLPESGAPISLALLPTGVPGCR